MSDKYDVVIKSDDPKFYRDVLFDNINELNSNINKMVFALLISSIFSSLVDIIVICFLITM